MLIKKKIYGAQDEEPGQMREGGGRVGQLLEWGLVESCAGVHI